MSLPQAKPVLKLDWCSHEAAKYACKNWHYSKSLPGADMVKVGVWEDAVFKGVVIFSRGANKNIGSVLGLKQTEICELTRISLREHSAPVSQIVTIALRLLRAYCPALRAILSYADPAQGHHGGIYQAMGWAYIGECKPLCCVIVNGKPIHKRTASSRWGTCSPARIMALTGLPAKWGPLGSKYAYYLPLDTETREKTMKLAKPYPKRAASITADAPGLQPGEGGSAPTAALQ